MGAIALMHCKKGFIEFTKTNFVAVGIGSADLHLQAIAQINIALKAMGKL
jgi:hypothetical protein